MNEKPHYSMLVQWSDENQTYLVTLPKREGRVFGPVTHGDTYEEAVRNGHGVLKMLVEAAQESGQPPCTAPLRRRVVGDLDSANWPRYSSP